MIVQCYFSVSINPVPSAAELDALRAITAANLHYPVGRATDTRMLCRALVEEANIAPTRAALEEMGKAPVICGVFSQDGTPLAGFDYNPAERGMYFAAYTVTGEDGITPIEISPADNTAAGWTAPQWQ